MRNVALEFAWPNRLLTVTTSMPYALQDDLRGVIALSVINAGGIIARLIAGTMGPAYKYRFCSRRDLEDFHPEATAFNFFENSPQWLATRSAEPQRMQMQTAPVRLAMGRVQMWRALVDEPQRQRRRRRRPGNHITDRDTLKALARPNTLIDG